MLKDPYHISNWGCRKGLSYSGILNIMNENYSAVKNYLSMVNPYNLHKWEDQGLSQQSSRLHVSSLSKPPATQNWPAYFKWQTAMQIKRPGGRKWKLQ